jgi:uncharacterized membrane protein YhaH (DUF805 family)
MLEAIKYNLAHLADFSGREGRPTFWWYVLFLVILDIVLGLILSGSMAAGGISSAYHAAQSGASQEALQAQMMQQMGRNLGTMMWVSSGFKLLITALSVAAFVRRLHDSNNSGWWAALAVAAQVAALAVALSMAGQIETMMASMASGDLTPAIEARAQMSRLGLLGWIAPIVVLVFGVMKSTPGPNRYGEAPQAS